jgi:hypothetical protein
LFAGQAETSKESINKSYKCEWSGDIFEGDKVIECVTNVAKHHDPSDWQRHIWAPHGRLLRLEECAGRTKSKYSYAAGKFILDFSKVVSLKMAKMEGANLTDPAQRSKYDAFVDASAPKVSKLCNPSNPSDLAKVEAINRERVLRNLTPYSESEYHRVFLTVEPHEIWAGCIVKVCGRAYWSDIRKKVHLALEQVLLVREGPRLVGGDKSAEDVFGSGLVPDPSMAPPPSPAKVYASVPPAAPPPPPPPSQQGWAI